MEENAGIVRLTIEHDFVFMGNDERKRYISGKGDTIAMYYDLKKI